jgi:hypothetical protein
MEGVRPEYVLYCTYVCIMDDYDEQQPADGQFLVWLSSQRHFVQKYN